MLTLIVEEYFQKIYSFLTRIFKVEFSTKWERKDYLKSLLIHFIASIIGMVLPIIIVAVIVFLIVLV